jgi:hypothetical protein
MNSPDKIINNKEISTKLKLVFNKSPPIQNSLLYGKPAFKIAHKEKLRPSYSQSRHQPTQHIGNNWCIFIIGFRSEPHFHYTRVRSNEPTLR